MARTIKGGVLQKISSIATWAGIEGRKTKFRSQSITTMERLSKFALLIGEDFQLKAIIFGH